jgi:DNA end-binding protein Ku
MSARSIGSGTISFGLVSIPIKLYTAASAKSVSFNLLHQKCGGRMKQQYHCPTCNEIVERKDMGKGFEAARDTFVKFTEEELKALEAERTDALDLIEFAPLDTVDMLQIEKTYFLGPDKGGERAYRLLSESLERAGLVAVGRFSTRGKDNLVLVRPYQKGLILHETYYADELRAFSEVETGGAFEFKQIETELADKLIEQLKVAKFEPEKYHDLYAERVRAAAEKKLEGKEIVSAAEEPKAKIVDLLEALKRSVAAAASTSNTNSTATAKPAATSPAVSTTAEAAPEATGSSPAVAEKKGPKKASPRAAEGGKKKTASS